MPGIQPDFQVENHGSLYLIRCISDEALEWAKKNTNGNGSEVQWFGNAFAVEPCYVVDIVNGMINDGLVN